MAVSKRTSPGRMIPMKRLLCLLLAAALLLSPALAQDAPRTPLYEALTLLKFSLREEPETTRFLEEVPEDASVTVYEYNEDWCFISWHGCTGWARTRWLWSFRSLAPDKVSPPGYRACGGVVTLTEETLITGGKFKGLNAGPGVIVAVWDKTAGGYSLPVWRDGGEIPLSAGEYTAFTPWAEARPGDLIGGFTTYYHETTGAPLHLERAFNIALGCERIDGTVLSPGTQFSFNALCGPYRKKNGYQLAPNVSRSGQGYGGGVCQVSTTLFNAVLGLPLQVDAYACHQKSGVPYIPIGFDSAVGSYSDLLFTNTLPYPIRIQADPQGGAVTVLIYRAEE